MSLNTGRQMNKGSTFTRHIVVSTSELGKNPEHPPTIKAYGVTPALEFTVGTDLAYCIRHVASRYTDGTDINISIMWTRSATGTDESTKTVKWQIKYLVIKQGENCNSGETTATVQDTYDSSSTTEQVIYQTDNITIPASSITSGDCVILEISAITPTGTALSEPALVAVCCTYTAEQKVVA